MKIFKKKKENKGVNLSYDDFLLMNILSDIAKQENAQLKSIEKQQFSVLEAARQRNRTSFPKVEFINSNEKKKVTTIKFKDGKLIQAKCSPDEQFDEFTGLMVCMFKYHTGMTNQQMQKWLKRMKRREVK